MSRPRSKTVTLGMVHSRLRADRGRARDHDCVECGGRALDWAFQHTGAALRDPATGRWYSEDPDDYAPMCRSCHFKLDVSRSERWSRSLRETGFQPGHVAKPKPLNQNQLAVLAAGRNRAATIRRRCSTCGLESTPAGVGTHQKATGHRGTEEV